MKNLIETGILLLAIVLAGSTTVNCAPNKEKKASIKSELIEKSVDPYLKMEPWMLKVEEFSSITLDEEMKAESWMLNVEEFVKQKANSITPKDEDLAFEAWMLDFMRWKDNRKAIK